MTSTDVFRKFLNYWSSAKYAEEENSAILLVHLFRDRVSIANTFNKFLVL